MRSKTTPASRLCYRDREADNPETDPQYAIRADKPPYIVSPHKLNLLFDSDENDEALFARLKRERQLYRQFSSADTPAELRRRLQEEVAQLGFSEYAFLRLDRVATPAASEALMPTELLSSCSERVAQRCGLMLQAGIADARNRHLSALFHWVAAAETDARAIKNHQSVLIVGAQGAGYYLVITGRPGANGYLWMSGPGQARDTDAFHQRVENNQYALNLLATTIEAVGTSKFPTLFRHQNRGQANTITPRPLRLLNTLAKRDATLREAADRLCLSTDTINKHVAAAKATLGTNTLAGTLWQALQAGLIDTEDP
ncbi:hypothetical protein FKG94_22195 [Exilibacterium tricleocarpae]|uniref:Uncharacterized protein n=1 Tax=Exilibacterium tricleocarpae TaxID=2591008 RepID=A0A545SY23_9GAMM|nr:hypothetical protein [Exilibacterium tricleocarpae]TQV69866.1 hypothetical protein FKG94_22195 [Exilibacterium tricleocarpae]